MSDTREESKASNIAFTSADHWNNKWEKLKTWRTVQSSILSKLSTNEAHDNEDITVQHGLKMVGSLPHPDLLRSLTCMKTMNGLLFVTNSGNDMRSYINVWNVRAFGQQVTKKKFAVAMRFTLIKYLPKYKRFVAYSPDQKLRLIDDVTRNFEIISEISTPNAFFCLEWNADTEEILCGGSHGVYVYRVTKDLHLEDGIPYNLSTTAKGMSWCISIQVDVKNSQIMAVCDDKIFVYNYQKRVCTHVLMNRHTLSLTCCVFYTAKDMLITAAKDGSIKIWNGMAFTQVAEISAHTAAVTDMQLHTADSLLISCSLDYTVKVWRLDTFEMFMRVDVGDKIRGMRMLNLDEMYVWTDTHIKLYKVNMVYTFYAPIYSTVQYLERVSSYGSPPNIICSSADGVVRVFTSLTAHTYTTIFPQKDFQAVTQLAYVKSASEMLAVLKSGDVVVYDVSSNPSRGVRVLEANVRHDEQVLSVSLIKLDRALGRQESAHCEYLVFAGHKNGEISLLYSTKIKLIDVCRAHLSPVEIMESSEGTLGSSSGLENPLGGSDRLISSGKDSKVKIWGLLFEELDPCMCSLICLKSIELDPVGLPLKICMFGNTLAVAFRANKTGRSRLMMYSLAEEESSNNLNERRKSIVTTPDKGIKCLKHSRSFDHKTDINGLSCHSYHQIFVSTSGDGCLKVWDSRNTLIRELLFDDSLASCCFADVKGTILVGFKNHISAISMESYLPNSILERLILQEFMDEEGEDPLTYDGTTNLADVALLPREPAVANVLRNVRMTRDSKSEEAGEGESMASEEDTKKKRNRPSSRVMWRKLGVSQRVVNMLSSATFSAANTADGSTLHITNSTDKDASDAPSNHHVHHSERYPLPLPQYTLEPTKALTKAQFDSEVRHLTKSKNDVVVEERRRRLEVARQLEEEKKNKRKWYPIAPDGEIPNSILRELLDDLAGKDVAEEQPKLSFTHIAMLIAKLPGLDGAKKSVNEFLVEKIRAKKESLAKRKQNSAKDRPSAQCKAALETAAAVDKMVVSLIADDSKMAMDCICWSNDYLDSVPEIRHLIIRGEDVIDLTPADRPKSAPRLDPAKRTLSPQARFKGAVESKEKGLHLLKEISKEPWWNKTSPLSASAALEQIMQLLPRSSARLHDSLISYLTQIHMVFGIPQSTWLSLAEAIVRNTHLQQDHEDPILHNLNAVGDIQLNHPKIIGELARMVQSESRPPIMNLALALLKRFSADEQIDKDRLEELAHADDNLDIMNSQNPDEITELRVGSRQSYMKSSVSKPTTSAASKNVVNVSDSSSLSPTQSFLEVRQSSELVELVELTTELTTEKSANSGRPSIYQPGSVKLRRTHGSTSKAGSTARKLGEELRSTVESASSNMSSTASTIQDEGENRSPSDSNVYSSSRLRTRPESRGKRNAAKKTSVMGIPEQDEDEEADEADSTGLSTVDSRVLTHLRPGHRRAVAASARVVGRDSGIDSSIKTPAGLTDPDDSPMHFPIVTPSLNDHPTLSMDATDYVDSSTFGDADMNWNHTDLLSSADDGDIGDTVEGKERSYRSQIKALKQMSNAKSEQWLRDNTLPPIQAGYRLGTASQPCQKLTEQDYLMCKHVESLERGGHNYKDLHDRSEVAVTDIIRGLWSKGDAAEGWAASSNPDVGKPSAASSYRDALSKGPGGVEFQWDSPLPPAPGSKLNLVGWKDMHSRYCEYWRLVRKRMHEHTVTLKDDCFPNLPSANHVVTGNQRHRHRLFPSHTELLLRQTESKTIDYALWCPWFHYSFMFDLTNISLETPPR